MTDRKQALIELRDKVKAGELHRKANCIAMMEGLSGAYIPNGAAWTLSAANGSLDAAKALHEAVLPGWGWRVAQCHVSDDAWVMAPDDSLAPDGEEWSTYTDIDQRPPGNPARAWLLAILEALIAMEADA